MKNNLNHEWLSYKVTPEAHKTIVDFFTRLDKNTVENTFATPYKGEAFSEDEVEIKTAMLFNFFLNTVLGATDNLSSEDNASEGST